MKTMRVVAVVAVLALVGSACDGDSDTTDQATGPSGDETPQRGGTLRVARSESFDGWVLDSAAAYASYQTQYAVIETLVRSTPDGQSLEPGLAESWDYDPEGPSWTFVLRDGLVFSDGTPLTSADVAWSEGIWAKGPNFGAVYAGIKKVRTPDDRTVIFQLYDPDTTLPVVMSWSASGVMPEDFGGRTEEEYYEQPVGAGAFTVEEWSPGGRIVLRRNDRYYDPDRPYVDEVVIDVITDPNERAVQLQSGQVDIAEYVSPVTAAQYGDTIVALPESQVEHLSLNTTREPFDDVDVRRAVAHAIDYEGIAGGPFSGYSSPPQGIIAPNLPNWAPPSVPPFAQDVEEAKRLVGGSKYPDPDTVELVYDSGLPADHLVAQIVQSKPGRGRHRCGTHGPGDGRVPRPGVRCGCGHGPVVVRGDLTGRHRSRRMDPRDVLVVHGLGNRHASGPVVRVHGDRLVGGEGSHHHGDPGSVDRERPGDQPDRVPGAPCRQRHGQGIRLASVGGLLLRPDLDRALTRRGWTPSTT